METNRLESAQKMRSIFDKTGGDYSKVEATDRQELLKLFDNNEANLKRTWQMMADRGQSQTGSPGAAGMPGR